MFGISFIYLFIFLFYFILENCTVYKLTWKKYCRVGQATDDDMAHALFMLDI